MVFNMNMNKIVCECLQVTNGDIRNAVYDGASSLEEVQEITGAATGCGACADNVQRLIDFFMSERDS